MGSFYLLAVGGSFVGDAPHPLAFALALGVITIAIAIAYDRCDASRRTQPPEQDVA